MKRFDGSAPNAVRTRNGLASVVSPDNRTSSSGQDSSPRKRIARPPLPSPTAAPIFVTEAAMVALRKELVFLEALLILTVVTACLSQGAKNLENRPKSLIVLPSASDLQYVLFQGRPQLSYTVYVDYPAESVLETISNRLHATGWTPLKSDFWNPSIPSSLVRGWQQFEDATTKPRAMVNSWMAQWENAHHDIVSYSLEYRYPVDSKSDLCTLRVLAMFVPASIAAKMPKADSR